MPEQQPSIVGDLHLVVAWSSGLSTIARLVKTSEDVNNALRMNAQGATNKLVDPTPYEPDGELEDNSHMVGSPDELLDNGLIDALRQGSSLPLATDEELRNKPLKCHAVLIGNRDNPTIFVKKRSPLQLARKSVVATLFNNTLDRLESPIFAFDNHYDVIITSSTLYVLDKKAFEGLFKESAAVLAQTSKWIAGVAATVPMTADSATTLEGALRRNQFLRNKFLAISRRPHLQLLTAVALRDEIVRCGYDPADLMMGEELNVTYKNVKTILQLLNEDLFTGGFSNSHYAASSKRSTSS